ncbi:MAG TPA: aminomethyl-transferring glycine dehydrogenase subunit GcvPA [Candidatus Obscuribacterales bacterium]
MTDATKPEHFPYLPHTKSDRDAMLKAIGVKTFDELLAHIPKEVRAKELNLEPGLSELELTQKISQLAFKNKPASQQASFLGAGCYRRYVPAAVGNIVSRGEFATAYTPYQPEVSQGSLQAIYEFQTAICLLTGMEVANASMYDGPTACAEAALMAARLTDRKHFLISEALNPEYGIVTKTYLKTSGQTYKTVPAPAGVAPASEMEVDENTAAIIVQYPNYFGCFEDLKALAEQAHKHGALLVVVTDPISLGLLEPPSSFGADIVVGDAQQCGNYLSFGGPSAGYMATRMQFVRQLPGRLAGMTVDKTGKRAFTLTLQTREQHIRRANATSNICTNQALNALAMLIYLTLVGPEGLKTIAEISLQRAHYLADALSAVPGVSLKFKQRFFSDFVIETAHPAGKVLSALQEDGVLGGVDLARFWDKYKNCILVSVTEMNNPSELDKFAQGLPRALARLGATEPSASAASSALAHKR